MLRSAPTSLLPLDLPEPRPQPLPASKVSANQSVIHTNLASLAQAIEDGNFLGISVPAGRATVALWSRFLSRLPGREIAVVVTELQALDRELAVPPDDLNPHNLGARLLALGLATRAVASDRIGMLGLALDRLADGLIAGAHALDSWSN